MNLLKVMLASLSFFLLLIFAMILLVRHEIKEREENGKED